MGYFTMSTVFTVQCFHTIEYGGDILLAQSIHHPCKSPPVWGTKETYLLSKPLSWRVNLTFPSAPLASVGFSLR
jgi:hypothetical protein